MQRISSAMPHNNSRFYLSQHESRLNKSQSQISSQNKINELRDDPLAASHAVRYASQLSRLQRFEKNTQYAMDHYNVVHTYMNEATSILHRVRELAVLGANGIYSGEDQRIMGMEINELLKELVSVANAGGQDGMRLFSGDKAFTEPFRIVEGRVEGGDDVMVLRVEYRGAGASRSTEISDGTFTELDIGGGEAFWAEKMHIFSNRDASGFRVREQGSFFIDGIEIGVNAGDTLPSIVAKINDSGAPVRAYIDPQTRGLALEGLTPHLIRAEDGAGQANVLRELGIIRGNMENNAPNWDTTNSRVSGGSMFDMLVRLRDSLLKGDYEFVGSQGIAGMDLALGNLTSRMAEVGSRQERVEMTWQRLNREIPDITAHLSREMSVNMAQAATDLAMLDFAHKVGLQTAARVLPTTLLDFLR